MADQDDAIRSLREALEVSPENVPLRQHLADTLASAGRHDEAVDEYRKALDAGGGAPALKLKLARSYRAVGNRSAAFVIVEELLAGPRPSGSLHMLHARLLHDEGSDDRAARAYRLAVEADPSLSDTDLALQLRVDPSSGRDLDAPEDDEDEDFDGRRAVPRSGFQDTYEPTLEKPKLTFDDVGGMADLKDEIRMKIIHPLEHPEIFKAYGKQAGGGVLMYGPPGCGKTYLARATAGQVNASFISVGINDVLDMWIGNSEKNLHELFETARRNTPCVLFFDEADALGGRRTDRHSGAGKELINQFLAELDGVKSSNEGVLILGATNAPWHLDAAFRRPGRFDRVLFVPPPDEAARAEILRLMLRDKPIEDVDAVSLAGRAKDFSGADLKAVVDLAVEDKLREAMKLGALVPVTGKDLARAVKRHKPTTREWFATARNYALYSNQGGLYDDILDYLNLK